MVKGANGHHEEGYTEPKMVGQLVRALTTDAAFKAMYSYLHSLAVVEGPTK